MTTADECLAEPDCQNPIYGRGMCSKHWQQARKGKRPFVLASQVSLPRTATQDERFWAKVDKNGPMCAHTGTNCWTWTAATMDNGYGRFDNLLAHHFLVGKPPEGFEWDHLCFLRNCVRTDHLELVTRTENIRRQRSHGQGPRERCRNGHPYDETHTGLLANGKRYCKTCNREAQYRFRGGGPRQEVTECKWGHRFDDENTRIRANGSKACRACAREKARRYRAAKA
jgi:hypothetical protein